jgi:DNA-directed RNA polymerase sigma subunit (sigma70/sigma32)
MIHNYVPSNTIFTNKDELISDKEYNIYQAALKFDANRGAKFSTYLGNETKWMCLNIYNLDLNQDFSNNDHEKNIERELFKKIMELLKDYPDSRISQIFSMRYVEGSKNKVMPWKEVSQKIDMSIQGCINIHDATVRKLKIKLKEI